MLRVALLATAALLVTAPAAGAATYEVTSNADSGAGSLREAVEQANSDKAPDRIVFSRELTQTLTVRSTLPAITAPLDIEGPGASRLTLFGAGKTGILSVNLAKTEPVRITGISMRGGNAASGGAITSFGADIVLDHVVVSGNRASNSGGALNIAEGSLTLRNSRLRGNSAQFAGGAIQLYDAAMTVQHSEVSGSRAGGSGGGISVASPFGAVAVERSRVTGNAAGGNGGGIAVTNAPVQPLTVVRSEISGNEAAGDGGGVARTAAEQPVFIGVDVGGNRSGGRGADVYPLLLDSPVPQPATQAQPEGGGQPPATGGDGKPPAAGDAAPIAPATVSGGPAGQVSPATLLGGVAFAPPDAPDRVKAVIDAANFIARTPYVYGGGHASFYAPGYDCSGAVSFALYGGGFLDSPLDSSSLESWGAPGPGRWITVYANPGHALAVVAGRRWDTSGNARGSGPRWHLDMPDLSGYTVRHPSGY